MFVAFCLGVMGLFYAATEGVLMALASSVSPIASRTTGIALIATSVGVGKLLSSILFGALWQAYGVETALVLFAFAGVFVLMAVNRQFSVLGASSAD